MKRTGFKPKALPRRPERQWTGHTPDTRPAACRMADGAARMSVPVPKEAPIQHAGYMDLVRAMNCARCNAPPRSQFCHADQGKGTGIKTDCRRGWPGCAQCHYLVGSTGKLGKAERRAEEDRLAAQTRAAIVAAGLWPKSLPEWRE